MFEQPDDWLRESLPKFQAFSTPESYPDNPSDRGVVSDFKQSQESRWRNELGMDPDEVRVTVVIPIHNESKCLPSALGALMLSDIPDSAHIQFVFFLNGCTDDGLSKRIVKDFLADVGNVHECTIESLYDARDVNPRVKQVQKNNVQFLLVESDRPSKTHAINIANELAYQRGDHLTINIDANNWLDPDALRNIIRTSYRAMADGNALVIGGNSIISFRPSWLMNLRHRTQKSFERPSPLDSKALHGWLMSWNTSWFHIEGGLPEVACDDYALSLLTRRSGKEVLYDRDARIWGYQANSLGDQTRALGRMVRDRIQIREAYQDERVVQSILQDDEPFMKNIFGRISYLYSEIQSNPKRFPLAILRAIRWEVAILYGRNLYNKNPQSQTWGPIRSTK